MAKILKVIKPFYVMEVGDTFELTEDGKSYRSSFVEDHSTSDDNGTSVQAVYTSNYTISKEYAKMLINEGYLSVEMASSDCCTENNKFVNVFDEIEDMLNEYTYELNHIDEICADQPACLKVERETVLRNICTVLSHLKSLKK